MLKHLAFWSGRWRMLALGLALLLLLAASLAPVLAQVGPPPKPLVPNVEPAETQALPVLSEREAVDAALAAYAARADVGLAINSQDLLPATAFLQNRYRIYLARVQSDPLRLDPGQGATPTPSPTPTPEPLPSADVIAAIWPSPSIFVQPGGTLVYEIRLHNRGGGSSNETKLVFPYNRSQVALVASELNNRAGDWVSAIDNDSFSVTFGGLEEGKRRNGRIILRVNDGLEINPGNPVRIDLRARYRWRDDNNGGERYTNWAPVLVGNEVVDTPYFWVQVNPLEAPAGTEHSFYTNRLLPGEAVSTWINVNGGSGGIRSLSLRGTANSNGEVTLRLRNTDADPDLPAGTHQMVIYGQRSRLTGVVSFTVQ